DPQPLEAVMIRGPSARSLAAVAAAAAAAAMLACGERGPGPVGPMTELPRELSVVEREIVDGANAFGFDLFRLVHGAESAPNVFLSPLSASLALGMTLNGAAGETWDGMRAALRLGGRSEQEINEGYRSLIDLLYGLDADVDFRIANSLWARLDFPVLPSFYDAAREYFDAEARALRSEERRVGKECRSRRAPHHARQNATDGGSSAEQQDRGKQQRR